MNTLKIATFNIQNFYLQKEHKDINEYINKLRKIIDINNIDIIGLQELVPKIKRELKNYYNITGKNRFPILLYTNSYNESNPIVTKKTVEKTKTYRLPFMRSIIPRIATVTYINDNGKTIRVINTHLCLYKYHKTKIKELNKLLKIIRKDNIPTIIMGDFNLRKSSDELKYFIEELKYLNIKPVNNNNGTFNNSILDYIFVSNDFNIKNTEVIKNNISDHNLLITEIKLK